jgi:ribosomal protein S27E
MAFQEGTETLICQHCGACHKAKWYRLPVREQYLIRCKACGETLTEGKGVIDYFDVKLMEA